MITLKEEIFNLISRMTETIFFAEFNFADGKFG